MLLAVVAAGLAQHGGLCARAAGLGDVHELVGQQQAAGARVGREGAGAEHDVVADGERPGAEAIGRGGRRRA